MRLALIADIHSNSAALSAVMEAIDGAKVDEIVCLGDVVSLGPHPRETLEMVKAIDCPVVMGNCDAGMLHPVVIQGDDDNARISQSDAWTSEQLTETDQAFIETFLPTLDVALGTASVLCFHGSPQSFDDIIVPTTPDDVIESMLRGLGADLYAGGHTHWQMLRRVGEALVINPGSVGLAYDRTGPPESVKSAPWAEFALVDAINGGLEVSFRALHTTARSVATDLLNSGMPHRAWLAEGWR